MQVGEGCVDVGYGDGEHGQGRRKMVGCGAGLIVGGEWNGRS